MLVQGKLLNSGDDLSEVYNIRKKVFIEELGRNESEEFDDIDSEAMHVLIYEQNPNWQVNQIDSDSKKAVATGRIYFDGVKCQISKVSVLKEYRGLKYGDFAVKMLLNKAFTSGINEISIISDIDVAGFFESIGFHKNADNFIEDGIEKCNMIIHSQDLIKLCSINNKK